MGFDKVVKDILSVGNCIVLSLFIVHTIAVMFNIMLLIILFLWFTENRRWYTGVL